jgi:hypothetical protein
MLREISTQDDFSFVVDATDDRAENFAIKDIIIEQLNQLTLQGLSSLECFEVLYGQYPNKANLISDIITVRFSTVTL